MKRSQQRRAGGVQRVGEKEQECGKINGSVREKKKCQGRMIKTYQWLEWQSNMLVVSGLNSHVLLFFGSVDSCILDPVSVSFRRFMTASPSGPCGGYCRIMGS